MAAMTRMGNGYAYIEKECGHEHDFFHMASLLIIG